MNISILFKSFLLVNIVRSEKIRHGRHLEITSSTPAADGGNPEPPSWTNSAAMRSLEADSFDQRMVLNCRANGNPRPTMSWFLNGIPIDESHYSGYIKVRINDESQTVPKCTVLSLFNVCLFLIRGRV